MKVLILLLINILLFSNNLDLSKMKKLIFLFLLFPIFSPAQELLCRVSVNYSQVTTTNTQIFQSLERDISEFLNTTRWTNYVFSNIERIDCSILINIITYNGVDEFVGTMQVSSSRPVFDASLTSPIMNLKEKDGSLKFEYIENQPLTFNENTYTSELASVLAFYAYIIIGMDFDSFSELGGTAYFEKAQKIVANSQSVSDPSSPWKSFGTSKEDNRYFLAKNLTSPVYKTFRQAMYNYERLGMDQMTKDPTTGRQNIMQSLELIKQIFQKKPNNYIVNIFVETKRQEIINIFSQAPPQEANRVKQTMQIIDASHASDYDKIGQSTGN